MSEILKLFSDKDDCQKAFWFGSVNSYLRNKMPKDLLKSHPEDGLKAAELEAIGVSDDHGQTWGVGPASGAQKWSTHERKSDSVSCGSVSIQLPAGTTHFGGGASSRWKLPVMRVTVTTFVIPRYLQKKWMRNPGPGLPANSSAYWVTWNFLLLSSVPPGVVTVTKPVFAPLGTLAVR
jgi:hypothetical protein